MCVCVPSLDIWKLCHINTFWYILPVDQDEDEGTASEDVTEMYVRV